MNKYQILLKNDILIVDRFRVRTTDAFNSHRTNAWHTVKQPEIFYGRCSPEEKIFKAVNTSSALYLSPGIFSQREMPGHLGQPLWLRPCWPELGRKYLHLSELCCWHIKYSFTHFTEYFY